MTRTSFLGSRRIGRITWALDGPITADRVTHRKACADLTVFVAVLDEGHNAVHYVAVCDQFDEVLLGEMIPRYGCELTDPSDPECRPIWTRLNVDPWFGWPDIDLDGCP